MAEETLLAIRAPPGTRLDVPDPDEGMPGDERRYQIYLKSDEGPIDMYLTHISSIAYISLAILSTTRIRK